MSLACFEQDADGATASACDLPAKFPKWPHPLTEFTIDTVSSL